MNPSEYTCIYIYLYDICAYILQGIENLSYQGLEVCLICLNFLTLYSHLLVVLVNVHAANKDILETG